MIEKRVKTPCIGVCSTGIGDSVCRGCKRFVHEVIDWNSYTEVQKQVIDSRLEGFLTQVIQNKLVIVDEQLVRWQIETQQISVLEHRNIWCQLFELLKAGAGQIDEPAQYGFEIYPEHHHLTLVELRDAIDQEFWLLSDAYFQRYFPEIAAQA